MNALIWKLNRLRTMGVAEVVHRLRQALQTSWESRGRGLAKPAPAHTVEGANWLAGLHDVVEPRLYVAAADRILAGRFDVFSMRDAPLGFPPQWNRDPKTGTEVGLQFGKAIDYRDERVVGDVKYLWEPNRHLELVTLAQAWRLTGNARYAEAVRKYLQSWFDQCPYPCGIHWTSSLELAIRLVNWAVVWQLIGGHGSALFKGDGEVLRTQWLTSVFQHCHFITGHRSLYSSGNNHLLGEYMGLLVASLTWPCWKESARWRSLSAREFEAEALRQNGADGVNREQAIYYEHEVADMMLVCGLAARANGIPFGAAYWQRLEQMLVFLASMIDAGGGLPSIGDADDALIIRFVPESRYPVYTSLLATGAVLFDRPEFAAKAERFDDKSRWLLGSGAEGAFDALRSRCSVAALDALPRAFPEGGYYVLGHRLHAREEIRIVADAGPLGYLSIAAHGHADALSITLSVAGQPILVDPGTFAYHTQPKWRRYFRGTAAHNTVRVDAEDQSVSGGNFMWLRHAAARCESFETGAERDRWVGSHDGYKRLADPVTHRREVVFDKLGGLLDVTDELICNGPHEVEVHWHLAAGCAVRIEGAEVHVQHAAGSLILSMSNPAFVPECVRGREDPPLGWFSSEFDQKYASPTLRWQASLSGPVHWTTRISLFSGGASQ